MSENKDLETIKQQLQVGIDGMDWDGEFDDSAYKKIIAAASRMAAENKQYKEITERLAASGNNLGMALIELKTEIKRLKAELAKRPKIVRCVGCKNIKTIKCDDSNGPSVNYCALQNFTDTDGKTLYGCVELTDYCSAGVRRESEGSNETSCK